MQYVPYFFTGRSVISALVKSSMVCEKGSEAAGVMSKCLLGGGGVRMLGRGDLGVGRCTSSTSARDKTAEHERTITVSEVWISDESKMSF